MRKLILLAHQSLDGFAADEKGSFALFNPGPDNLAFVCSLTEEADALMAGRASYQLLESHWPTAHQLPTASKDEIAYSNWYNSSTKIVLSKTLTGTILPRTTIISDELPTEIDRLKQQPGKNILLFGSPTAFQSIAQLVDEFWIIQYPVLFGKGIRLFQNGKEAVKLEMIGTKQLIQGEIALHYTVKK
jgi:dihydrofolate reductase